MAEQSTSTGKHTAGALDIRNIIGGLLGTYGVILLLLGLFGDKEGEKTGGVNANLWAGIILIIVSVSFMTWARLRPVVVPEHLDKADLERPPGH
jgi:hypothetical protein